jgi:hypothetical protein
MEMAATPGELDLRGQISLFLSHAFLFCNILPVNFGDFCLVNMALRMLAVILARGVRGQ